MPNVITKYIIEFLDKDTVKTFRETDGSFSTIKLHGGDEYYFTGKGADDYWHCWKNETGHNSVDYVDICIIYPAKLDIADFIGVGQKLHVQTAGSVAWKLSDIEKYLKFTDRSMMKKKGGTQRLPQDVELSDGRRLFVERMASGSKNEAEVSPVLPKHKPMPSTEIETGGLDPEPAGSNEPPKKSVPTPKEIATKKEIDDAWGDLSRKHKTSK